MKSMKLSKPKTFLIIEYNYSLRLAIKLKKTTCYSKQCKIFKFLDKSSFN